MTNAAATKMVSERLGPSFFSSTASSLPSCRFAALHPASFRAPSVLRARRLARATAVPDNDSSANARSDAD